jgi:NAD(P)-dependent dehydrogenase (short-subunit alcohol dehydrogenase family)
MNDVVAVTGAAGALGGEVAKAMSRRGYKVALLDSERSRSRLEELRDSLKDSFCATGDLAEASTWREALAGIERAFGAAPKLAALVAGAWQGGSPLHAGSRDGTARAMMRANFETAYEGLRALLPAMVASSGGSIVLVGSRAAVQPWSSGGAAEYAASKAAVLALAQTAAAEVGDRGVRVNTILPSTLDTPANRAAMPKADATRWVSVASAAEVIAFLLSPEARDVSGAAVPVYGGA